MGHSAPAYEAAKERLKRKFGGKRRQVLIYFDDLGNFPQIRDGNAKYLEQFADLLDSAVIGLHEAGKHTEIGNGFLYITLQKKLPQSMLTSYHRWVYENNILESVITLKTWVVQESEFQTIANETIHGFTYPSVDIQTKRHTSKYDELRTFFGETGAILSLQKQILCRLCGANHCIWQCQKYLRKSVPGRWNFANQFLLCYRCLMDTLGNYALRVVSVDRMNVKSYIIGSYIKLTIFHPAQGIRARPRQNLLQTQDQKNVHLIQQPLLETQ